MVTVSTRQLVSAIDEAAALHPPDMNEGTSYLYNELYRRLSEGLDLRLSEIDFSRFELDDIDSVREMHSSFETNEEKVLTLMQTLRGISPVTVAAAFI